VKHSLLIITTLKIFFCCEFGNAQNTGINSNIRANNITNRLTQGVSTAPGEIVWGLSPDRESRVVGDTYFNSEFRPSWVVLYDKKQVIKEYQSKYNALQDEFEFSVGTDIKTLQGRKVSLVKYFDLQGTDTSVFVNGREFKIGGSHSSGFYELLVDGKVSLLKGIEIEILKPNYNVALGTGSTDTRYLKRFRWYYSVNGELTAIKSNRSLKALDKIAPGVSEFIFQNRIKSDEETDLVRLFQEINK